MGRVAESIDAPQRRTRRNGRLRPLAGWRLADWAGPSGARFHWWEPLGAAQPPEALVTQQEHAPRLAGERLPAAARLRVQCSAVRRWAVASGASKRFHMKSLLSGPLAASSALVSTPFGRGKLHGGTTEAREVSTRRQPRQLRRQPRHQRAQGRAVPLCGPSSAQ